MATFQKDVTVAFDDEHVGKGVENWVKSNGVGEHVAEELVAAGEKSREEDVGTG